MPGLYCANTVDNAFLEKTCTCIKDEVLKKHCPHQCENVIYTDCKENKIHEGEQLLIAYSFQQGLSKSSSL